MVDVIPGIFEQDFAEIEKKVRLVAPYVDWVQIDFADSTLVPAASNLEFEKFAKLIASHRENGHKLSFEAHLMVSSPEKYIKPLADAGFHRLIAHVESNDPRLFLDTAKFESVEAGIAIDGPTEIEHIDPYSDEADMILVMMAEAGASGQALQPENLEKVRAIHEHMLDLPIEVDQGINDHTAKIAAEAGATRLVSTSYIFKSMNPAQVEHAIETLKKA